MELVLRPATADDRPLLWRLLGEAAAWRPDAEVLTADALSDDAALARYARGWPRDGEVGVVAETRVETGGPVAVGGSWLRLLGGTERGYGWVADDVPELSIAVLAPWRGRGIGRRLLAAVLVSAGAAGHARVSLSVEDDNPARALYEQVGFVAVKQDHGATTMVASTSR